MKKTKKLDFTKQQYLRAILGLDNPDSKSELETALRKSNQILADKAGMEIEEVEAQIKKGNFLQIVEKIALRNYGGSEYERRMENLRNLLLKGKK